MTKQSKGGKAIGKEVRAWGVRRTEVDINQLALAYYLLARRRIEQQRRDADAANAQDDQDEAA